MKCARNPIEGRDFFDGKEVKIKDPLYLGTYIYESIGGEYKTVPIICSKKDYLKKKKSENRITFLPDSTEIK